MAKRGTERLPAEVWLSIFGFLPPKIVAQHVALACHRFHSLTEDESLWKHFCLLIGVSQKIAGHDWQKTFKICASKHHPPHVVWAVLGHVDCGKSTLCGRMLFECGARSKEEFENIQELATGMGKDSFSFAFLVNHLTAERERGITIDEHVVFCQRTGYSIGLINTPGHRSLIQTMYSASSMADCALLVVSSCDGEFEAGWFVNGQTKAHILLAFVMGLTKLVVAINKFDCGNYTYTNLRNAPEKRFEELKAEISRYTKTVGFKPENVTFVPISALTGDNLFPEVKGESQFPIIQWYQGPTLWEVLTAHPEPTRNIAAPLRMTIIKHFKKHQQDNETIVMGCILTGRVNVGDEVIFIPNFKNFEQDDHMTVVSIQKDHQSLHRAIPGDIVGVKVRGRKKIENVRKRHLCGRIMTHGPTSRTPMLSNPMVKMDTIKCQVIVVGGKTFITVGTRGMMLVHTAKIPVCITALLKKIDRRSGKVLEKSPNYLKRGDSAWMLIRPDYLVAADPKPLVKPPPQSKRAMRGARKKNPRPTARKTRKIPIDIPNEGYCVEPFANCAKMARFAFFISSTECNMVGMIKQVNPTRKKGK